MEGLNFSLSDPTPPGWSLPKEVYPTWKPDPDKEFDWTAQEKSPSLFDNFISNLGDELGANTKRFAGAGAKRDGDTYIKPPGATVADLGGGNTLYVPDTTTQMRMAQAPTPSGPGLGGKLAGAAAAAGVGMIPGVGPFLAPVAGNLVSGLFG